MDSKKIVKWADDRGILEETTPSLQMLKTVEEVGELASGIGKNDAHEIKDAIGDITITLMIQAHLNGFNFEDCVSSAWNEIKGRTGRVENGIFVKDEEQK